MKIVKNLLLTGAVVMLGNSLTAQTKKEKDVEAIKNMCGCFKVEFNFAETFNYSNDSTYTPSRVKHAGAIEYARLIVDENDELSIQHLLVVGKPGKEMIVKHWRQDWLFENTDFYMYDGDNKWDFVEKDEDSVKGQWTQKVYQVDDSPRYEGSATWVHVDGKSFWENTTPAPLPRREYTQRKDYNVTLRGNRHEITDFGWVHDQDNKKVIKKEGLENVIIAEEKGYNTYTRIDDSKCKIAEEYWVANEKLWKKIRKRWKKVFNRDKDLSLKAKYKGTRLYSRMFRLKPDAKSKEIKKIINNYVN